MISSANVVSIHENNGNEVFTDAVFLNNRLIGLTDKGSLVSILPDSNDNPKTIILTGVTYVTKDRQDHLVIIKSDNSIGKFINNSWEFSRPSKVPIKAVFYTSKNDEYFLTDSGFYSRKTQKYYFPDSSFNQQVRLIYAFTHISTKLIDKNDNIWLGYNHGEWGGDIYIFNTNNNRFIKPEFEQDWIELNPIFSFTQGPEDIYVSGGLSHLSITNSYLGVFRKFRFEKIFEGNLKGDKKDSSVFRHYFGPIAYNSFDSSFYIYSHLGIFKSRSVRGFESQKTWEKLFDPKLKWEYGQPNATGYGMNITKLESISSGSFFFVTVGQGIGYYKNKTCRLFK